MSCEWGMGWKWVVTGNVNAKRKDRLAPVPVGVGLPLFPLNVFVPNTVRCVWTYVITIKFECL